MSEYDLARVAAQQHKFETFDELAGFLKGYEAALLAVREWAAKKLGEVPGG
jgi:hypothetical protein